MALIAVAHAESAVWAKADVGAGTVVAAPIPHTASVSEEYPGTREVEVARTIVTDDGVVPSVAFPNDGAEEIVDGGIQIVLPIVKDAAQVTVAIRPI